MIFESRPHCIANSKYCSLVSECHWTPYKRIHSMTFANCVQARRIKRASSRQDIIAACLCTFICYIWLQNQGDWHIYLYYVLLKFKWTLKQMIMLCNYVILMLYMIIFRVLIKIIELLLKLHRRFWQKFLKLIKAAIILVNYTKTVIFCIAI